MTVEEVLQSGDPQKVVDFGIDLYRRLNAQGSELERVKAWLRAYAKPLALSRGVNTMQILGTIGAATVVFLRPTPQCREKGTDLGVLETQVPREVFDKLFVKRTVVDFAPNFEQELAKLDAAHREAIEKLVAIDSPTPRVNLPK